MGVREGILSIIAGLVFERPARKQSIGALATALEEAGNELGQRVAAAPDTEVNRKQLRHIMGIERWGQRRLRVALGAELLRDEYDEYAPAEYMPWAQLKEEWSSTRRETIAIARTLEQVGVGNAITVPHNEFGDLSVRGWLRYLNMHANIEAKRIKGS